jgi:hypothetical protein
MEREYRLMHKKDGTYVLQTLIGNISIDEDGNRHYSNYWADLQTAEEKDEDNDRG